MLLGSVNTSQVFFKKSALLPQLVQLIFIFLVKDFYSSSYVLSYYFLPFLAQFQDLFLTLMSLCKVLASPARHTETYAGHIHHHTRRC